MDSSATGRQIRLQQKVIEKALLQDNKVLNALRARKDFTSELAYFTDIMENYSDPESVAARVQKPLMALLCIQAPLELLYAFSLHPFKIFSGSYALAQLVASGLPALTCPMLRSALGAMQVSGNQQYLKGWILPTTCDWVVKFPEMLALCGVNQPKNLHWLELPHIKDDERGQKRWLEEIYALKDFLSKLIGIKLKRKNLLNAVNVYQKAHDAFMALIDLRRLGKVPSVWFTIISNAFWLDTPENWTLGLSKTLPAFEQNTPIPNGRVFLTGSPVFFPNYKILKLADEAGLYIAADDLCSGERIFPGSVTFSDTSEFGLLSALAERYHQGCLCPTFAGNDRRINNILRPAQKPYFNGVIFQALKGCHPYDLESFTLEKGLKKAGLKFVKLETDYTAEDSQNLLTRLEAFGQNLEAI